MGERRRTMTAVVCLAVLACGALPGRVAGQSSGQRGQQRTTGGSRSSGLGATQLEGLDRLGECMAPTRGYRERLTAQMLQRKLNEQANLSAEQRRRMEEDMRWLKATAEGARDLPQPDPKKPQRWMEVLEEEEQMEINTEYTRYTGDMNQWCDERHGGMTQYGDPSGRRPVHTTPQPQPRDLTTYRVPIPKTERAKGQEFLDCTAGQKTMQWKVLADKLESKARAGGFAGAQRTQVEEDIAMLRRAVQAGAKGMPSSADPKNPMRYVTWLTPQETMAAQMESHAAVQDLMTRCAAQGRTQTASAAPAAAPSPRQAAQPGERTQRRHSGAGGGSSLSAELGAGQADYLERSGAIACLERGRGYRAKVTAEMLEARLKEAGGLTAQQRKEWQEDIASWRAAEKANSSEPLPPDASNPERWRSRLSRADHREINRLHAANSNRLREECTPADPMGNRERKQ